MTNSDKWQIKICKCNLLGSSWLMFGVVRLVTVVTGLGRVLLLVLPPSDDTDPPPDDSDALFRVAWVSPGLAESIHIY